MSERFRVLVIGAGSIGERHLRCFLATSRVSAGFVEVRPELAEQIRQRHPGTISFPNLASALEKQWDVAVVATPAPMHIQQTIELLNRKINVLVEKPLSVELTGVDDLLRAEQQSSAIAGVAYVHRANPVLTEMRAAIHSGRFGKPVQLVATTGHDFPHARPAYADIYYAQRHLGGGAVQDALTHVINVGECLVGKIDRLVADVGHQLLPRVTVEDTAHVLARHGELMASYALNQYQAPTEITVTVACERGTVRFEAHQTRWRWMDRPDAGWTDSTPLVLERDTLFTRQADAFLNAVEGKGPVLCTLAEGLATLKVNRAILASAEQQCWKSVNSEGSKS